MILCYTKKYPLGEGGVFLSNAVAHMIHINRLTISVCKFLRPCMFIILTVFTLIYYTRHVRMPF